MCTRQNSRFYECSNLSINLNFSNLLRLNLARHTHTLLPYVKTNATDVLLTHIRLHANYLLIIIQLERFPITFNIVPVEFEYLAVVLVHEYHGIHVGHVLAHTDIHLLYLCIVRNRK